MSTDHDVEDDYREIAAQSYTRLSFPALREANVRRCESAWHSIESWSPTDWACAFAGEAGEACNLVKKLRRGDFVSAEDIGEELADTILYADLLAARLGVDLGAAIIKKFNLVSDQRVLDGNGGDRPTSDVHLVEDPPPTPPVKVEETEDERRIRFACEITDRCFGVGPSRWLFRRYLMLRRETQLALAFGILFGVPISMFLFRLFLYLTGVVR